jgi:hypothetical protein
VSESNLLWDEPAGVGVFNVYNSRQVAGRVRVSFRS